MFQPLLFSFTICKCIPVGASHLLNGRCCMKKPRRQHATTAAQPNGCMRRCAWTVSRGATRDFGPHEKKSNWALVLHGKKNYAVFYNTMHFNDIFYYHSHICEKNNMTVTWLLLTVPLVVLHAGLIYLHN